MNTLPLDLPSELQTREEISQILSDFSHILREETPQIWHDTSFTHKILRFSLLLSPETNVAHFFTLFKTPQKIYWKSRDNHVEVSGVGIGHRVEAHTPHLSSLLRDVHALTNNAPPNVRFFGGTRFYASSEANSPWNAFPDSSLTLPFLECERILDSVTLHCTLIAPASTSDSEAIREMELTFSGLFADVSTKDNSELHTTFAQPPLVQKRENTPSFQAWKMSIGKALQAFSRGNLEKVVMARRASLHCAESPDAFSLFQQRMLSAEHSTSFFFQENTTTAFFGVTPELLYSRAERSITTEAVAGTRKRGSHLEDDESIAQELLNSDKDRREHASVQRFIATALDELTETFSIGTVNVLKLHHLQHLYAAFSGRLRATVDDAAILEQLHPTPAVGGTPRREALEFLRTWENFDRGWYAAPVGWVNAHAAEFAVAIRSALVTDNTVHLFSGAGIVAGSEAEKEWQEIEMKIAPLLGLLG